MRPLNRFIVMAIVFVLGRGEAALAHLGDDPILGDPEDLVHACRRTSATGKVRMTFVGTSGTCPASPAWEPIHWSLAPSTLAARDVSVHVRWVTPNGSCCRTIAANTTTVVPFFSEDWDTDEMHDSAANPGRLTAQTAGKYLVYANVDWNGGSGLRRVCIAQNGQPKACVSENYSNIISSGNAQHIATQVELMAGQFVEVTVHHLPQTVNATSNVVSESGSSTRRTEFGMVKLP